MTNLEKSDNVGPRTVMFTLNEWKKPLNNIISSDHILHLTK